MYVICHLLLLVIAHHCGISLCLPDSWKSEVNEPTECQLTYVGMVRFARLTCDLERVKECRFISENDVDHTKYDKS